MEFVVNLADKSINDVSLEIGYESIRFTKTGEFSLVRHLNEDTIYPRFHLYGKRLNDHTVLKLHLDQIRPGKDKNLVHRREYRGEEVRMEAERIQHLLK